LDDVIVKFGADLTALKAGFTEAKSEGDSLGSKLGGVGTAAAAGLGVAAVAIGAFAIQSASTVNGAFSTMAKATGLQGTQLAGLETSWKSVYASVPVDATTLTSVVDKLNNSLHLQGPALTEASKDMVDYAKATGTDASSDTDTFTKALEGANTGLTGIKAPLMSMPQLTDMATVGFQKTGVSIDSIAPAFDKGTAAMSKMGLSIPAQISLLDGLTQEGLKAKTITPILTGIGPAAQAAGESSTKFWQDMVTHAQEGGKYTEAETKLLGKNADAFTAAGVSGKLSNDALTKSITDSQGATEKAGEAAETFGEKLELFKQNLTLAFAPLGTALIGILSSVLSALQPLIPVITMLATAFASMPAPIQLIVVGFLALVGGVGALQMVLSKFNMSITSLPKDIDKVTSSLKDMYAASTSGGLKIPSLGGGGAKAVEGEAAGAVEGVGGEAAGAEGLTAGLGGAVAEGGILATVLATIGPILLPVVAIVASIAAVFAVLYATSSTFRGAVGDLIGQFQSLVGWVGTLVGDLTSLNFGKLGSDLTSGFSSGFNTIKNDIMGFPGMMITAVGESASTISNLLGGAFDTLKHIDWGGMFAGGLDAIDKFLTSLLNFDPTPMITSLINAIGGAFDSLFGGGGGGGGTAGTKASSGLSSGLSQGMAKAGPDILGKLGDVFVKLLVLLPTIFAKIGLALFDALSKVDWSNVFSKLAGAATVLGTALMSALKGVNWNQIFTLIFVQLTYFGQAIIKAFQGIDWGKAFTMLVAALGVAAVALLTWLVGLDWGKFATTVWNALVDAIGGIVTWIIGLPWASWAATLWNDIVSALGQFGTWLWGLVSGFGGKLYSDIQSGVGAFGTWLDSLVSGVGTAIMDAIKAAVNFGAFLVSDVTSAAGNIGNAIMTGIKSVVDLGAWLVSSVTAAAGNIGNEVKNAILGAIGGAGSAAAKTLGLQGGGIVGPQSGGILATLAEAGEAEVVVPWHRVGEDWGSLIASLPHYGSGGVVVPSGSVGVTGSKQTSASGVTNYNTYVTVDSENITRKVLMAIDEKERYHHLLG
jgi:hypothetical protein